MHSQYQKNHRNTFSNFGNTRWRDLILTPSLCAHRETKDQKHYNVNKLTRRLLHTWLQFNLQRIFSKQKQN
jgi:hypothetical protein